MTEKDLKIAELAKEIEAKGFDFVSKKYKYSRRRLLNTLYATSNMSMLNKKQRRTFLTILEKQLFKWKLYDNKKNSFIDFCGKNRIYKKRL